MPERRSPSLAPSEDSTETLRWMASTVQNRTATQKRPGAPLAITWRSGPRAKAKRTRATIPNGATWDSATRERPSIRRSLPAIRAASRHMGHPFLLHVGDVHIGDLHIGDLHIGTQCRLGAATTDPVQRTLGRHTTAGHRDGTRGQVFDRA